MAICELKRQSMWEFLSKIGQDPNLLAVFKWYLQDMGQAKIKWWESYLKARMKMQRFVLSSQISNDLYKSDIISGIAKYWVDTSSEAVLQSLKSLESTNKLSDEVMSQLNITKDWVADITKAFEEKLVYDYLYELNFGKNTALKKATGDVYKEDGFVTMTKAQQTAYIKKTSKALSDRYKAKWVADIRQEILTRLKSDILPTDTKESDMLVDYIRLNELYNIDLNVEDTIDNLKYLKVDKTDISVRPDFLWKSFKDADELQRELLRWLAYIVRAPIEEQQQILSEYATRLFSYKTKVSNTKKLNLALTMHYLNLKYTDISLVSDEVREWARLRNIFNYYWISNTPATAINNKNAIDSWLRTYLASNKKDVSIDVILKWAKTFTINKNTLNKALHIVWFDTFLEEEIYQIAKWLKAKNVPTKSIQSVVDATEKQIAKEVKIIEGNKLINNKTIAISDEINNIKDKLSLLNNKYINVKQSTNRLITENSTKISWIKPWSIEDEGWYIYNVWEYFTKKELKWIINGLESLNKQSEMFDDLSKWRDIWWSTFDEYESIIKSNPDEYIKNPYTFSDYQNNLKNRYNQIESEWIKATIEERVLKKEFDSFMEREQRLWYIWKNKIKDPEVKKKNVDDYYRDFEEFRVRVAQEFNLDYWIWVNNVDDIFERRWKSESTIVPRTNTYKSKAKREELKREKLIKKYWTKKEDTVIEKQYFNTKEFNKDQREIKLMNSKIESLYNKIKKEQDKIKEVMETPNIKSEEKAKTKLLKEEYIAQLRRDTQTITTDTAYNAALKDTVSSYSFKKWQKIIYVNNSKTPVDIANERYTLSIAKDVNKVTTTLKQALELYRKSKWEVVIVVNWPDNVAELNKLKEHRESVNIAVNDIDPSLRFTVVDKKLHISSAQKWTIERTKLKLTDMWVDAFDVQWTDIDVEWFAKFMDEVYGTKPDTRFLENNPSFTTDWFANPDPVYVKRTYDWVLHISEWKHIVETRNLPQEYKNIQVLENDAIIDDFIEKEWYKFEDGKQAELLEWVSDETLRDTYFFYENSVSLTEKDTAKKALYSFLWITEPQYTLGQEDKIFTATQSLSKEYILPRNIVNDAYLWNRTGKWEDYIKQFIVLNEDKFLLWAKKEVTNLKNKPKASRKKREVTEWAKNEARVILEKAYNESKPISSWLPVIKLDWENLSIWWKEVSNDLVFVNYNPKPFIEDIMKSIPTGWPVKIPKNTKKWIKQSNTLLEWYLETINAYKKAIDKSKNAEEIRWLYSDMQYYTITYNKQMKLLYGADGSVWYSLIPLSNTDTIVSMKTKIKNNLSNNYDDAKRFTDGITDRIKKLKEKQALPTYQEDRYFDIRDNWFTQDVRWGLIRITTIDDEIQSLVSDLPWYLDNIDEVYAVRRYWTKWLQLETKQKVLDLLTTIQRNFNISSTKDTKITALKLAYKQNPTALWIINNNFVVETSSVIDWKTVYLPQSWRDSQIENLDLDRRIKNNLFKKLSSKMKSKEWLTEEYILKIVQDEYKNINIPDAKAPAYVALLIPYLAVGNLEVADNVAKQVRTTSLDVIESWILAKNEWQELNVTMNWTQIPVSDFISNSNGKYYYDASVRIEAEVEVKDVLPDDIKKEIDSLKANKQLDPLYDEARKYKSADDMISWLEKDGKILYHWTPNKFETFDKNMIWTSTDSGMFWKWFYFTNDYKIADTYTRRWNIVWEVKKAYLDIKNPYIINKESDIPKIDVPEKTMDDLVNAPKIYSEKFTEYLQQKWYDWVIDNMWNYPQTIVFEPSQIKTKSQLRKIREEATRKQNPLVSKSDKTIKELQPLYDEARKYKSAELTDIWNKSQSKPSALEQEVEVKDVLPDDIKKEIDAQKARDEQATQWYDNIHNSNSWLFTFNQDLAKWTTLSEWKWVMEWAWHQTVKNKFYDEFILLLPNWWNNWFVTKNKMDDVVVANIDEFFQTYEKLLANRSPYWPWFKMPSFIKADSNIQTAAWHLFSYNDRIATTTKKLANNVEIDWYWIVDLDSILKDTHSVVSLKQEFLKAGKNPEEYNKALGKLRIYWQTVNDGSLLRQTTLEYPNKFREAFKDYDTFVKAFWEPEVSSSKVVPNVTKESSEVKQKKLYNNWINRTYVWDFFSSIMWDTKTTGWANGVRALLTVPELVARTVSVFWTVHAMLQQMPAYINTLARKDINIWDLALATRELGIWVTGDVDFDLLYKAIADKYNKKVLSVSDFERASNDKALKAELKASWLRVLEQSFQAPGNIADMMFRPLYRALALEQALKYNWVQIFWDYKWLKEFLDDDLVSQARKEEVFQSINRIFSAQYENFNSFPWWVRWQRWGRNELLALMNGKISYGSKATDFKVWLSLLTDTLFWFKGSRWMYWMDKLARTLRWLGNEIKYFWKTGDWRTAYENIFNEPRYANLWNEMSSWALAAKFQERYTREDWKTWEDLSTKERIDLVLDAGQTFTMIWAQPNTNYIWRLYSSMYVAVENIYEIAQLEWRNITLPEILEASIKWMWSQLGTDLYRPWRITADVLSLVYKSINQWTSRDEASNLLSVLSKRNMQYDLEYSYSNDIHIEQSYISRFNPIIWSTNKEKLTQDDINKKTKLLKLMWDSAPLSEKITTYLPILKNVLNLFDLSGSLSITQQTDVLDKLSKNQWYVNYHMNWVVTPTSPSWEIAFSKAVADFFDSKKVLWLKQWLEEYITNWEITNKNLARMLEESWVTDTTEAYELYQALQSKSWAYTAKEAQLLLQWVLWGNAVGSSHWIIQMAMIQEYKDYEKQRKKAQPKWWKDVPPWVKAQIQEFIYRKYEWDLIQTDRIHMNELALDIAVHEDQEISELVFVDSKTDVDYKGNPEKELRPFFKDMVYKYNESMRAYKDWLPSPEKVSSPLSASINSTALTPEQQAIMAKIKLDEIDQMPYTPEEKFEIKVRVFQWTPWLLRNIDSYNITDDIKDSIKSQFSNTLRDIVDADTFSYLAGKAMWFDDNGWWGSGWGWGSGGKISNDLAKAIKDITKTANQSNYNESKIKYPQVDSMFQYTPNPQARKQLEDLQLKLWIAKSEPAINIYNKWTTGKTTGSIKAPKVKKYVYKPKKLWTTQKK